MRIWLSISVIALLGGCATAPEPLRGEFPALTPQASLNQGISNQRVRWGGEIVDAIPGRDETCFEVLGQNLNDQGRPVESANSQGRFIACAQGFYDPAIYAEGREVTVVGTLTTTLTRKIGDYDYRYPQVSAQQVYLWPEESTYARRPYSGYPYYGPPYYGYPYYGYPYSSSFSLGFFGYNNYYPGYYGGPFYYRDRHPIINKPRPPDNAAPPNQKPSPPSKPSFSELKEKFQMQKPAPPPTPPRVSVPPRPNLQKGSPSAGAINRFRSSG
jgi:outer membrane lipoprotein